MKIKNKRKITLFLISIILISFLSIFTINTICKNKKIDNMVSEFIKDSEYSFSYDIYDFYKVENNSLNDSKTFTYVDNTLYAGSKGDILTCLKNEFDSKTFSYLFSFYFGGHACLVVNDTQYIETTGKSAKGENKVKLVENNWIHNNTKRQSFICLKVNCSEYTKEKAIDNAISKLGIPYNFFFLFNTKNRYYCTDLVTRSYNEVDDFVDICRNKKVISIQDIILSNNLYISIYKEKNLKSNTQGFYNIYYLDDGIDYASLLG